MDLYVDGSSKGNPGPGKAVAIIDQNSCGFLEKEEVLVKRLEEPNTNNQAEYYSLILALDWIENTIDEIKKNNEREIRIFTDSRLIEGHINRNWKVNKNRSLVFKAKKKLREIKKEIDVSILWISREENIAGIMIEDGEV